MIEALPLPMPAVMGRVNVYLIRTEQGGFLVDTGLKDNTSQKELEQALLDRGLRFSDIDSVFLTHYHADHAGLARFLQQEGAKIYMSKIDASALLKFHQHPEADTERSAFLRKIGLPDKFVQSSLSAFTLMRKLCEELTPDVLLCGGETIVLSGIPFEALACPGHTEGHLCLLNRDLKIAFTGDSVISPRATHLSASSLQRGGDPYLDYVESLLRLQTLTDVIPLSGHGSHQRPLHISAQKIRAYLETELSSLRERLTDTPTSAYSLSQTVQEMRPRVFPHWLAVSQTAAYLNHLVSTEDAVCDDLGEVLLFRRAN